MGGQEAEPGKVDDDRALLQIGEAAKDFGFTPRALRFYEEKGLISPRRLGDRRFYSAADRRRLAIIARGKRLGLALDEIANIVNAENSGDSRHQLKVELEVYLAHVEFLEAEQEDLSERLKGAQSLIDELRARLGETE